MKLWKKGLKNRILRIVLCECLCVMYDSTNRARAFDIAHSNTGKCWWFFFLFLFSISRYTISRSFFVQISFTTEYIFRSRRSSLSSFTLCLCELVLWCSCRPYFYPYKFFYSHSIYSVLCVHCSVFALFFSLTIVFYWTLYSSVFMHM